MVGRVTVLRRYPVSSAAGERRASLEAGPDGLAHDRQFALVDAVTGQTAAPERERRWHATPLVRSRVNGDGGLELQMPGEPFLPAWSDEAAQALRRHFGFLVAVRRYAPERAGEPRAKPRYRPSHAHLLTSASLRQLQAELPESCLDLERFRPSLYVETAAGLEGMVEQGWIGRELLVGRVRFAVNKPCGRCSFTTLPQAGFALDREVLRALIRGHERQFGVICHVVSGGTIAEGDAVVLL